MAATYDKVSRLIPSSQRAAKITDVVATDQIDITEILGRPANGVIFYVGAATDVVSYRVNNKIQRQQDVATTEKTGPVVDTFWLASDVFTASGATVLESVINLKFSSIEITGLTLASGTTIEMVVY